MDITPEGAFKRLVAERKGSYCFGQNTVLLGMPLGMGYRSYAVLARVNEADAGAPLNYTSLVHMVELIHPFEDSDQICLVNTGFGSPGLIRPILLSNVEENIAVGITQQRSTD